MKILRILNVLIIIPLMSSICYAEQVSFKEVPLKTCNEELSLNLLRTDKVFGMISGTDKGMGYYSRNEKGVLDGFFHLESTKSGRDEQLETNYLFETAVDGNFKDGMKDGIWRYKYVFDDGIDLYESHKIEIEYKNDKCIQSSFDGVIGHTMHKTNHKFKNQQYCTPAAIRHKAWEIWSAEFEKINKGK